MAGQFGLDRMFRWVRSRLAGQRLDPSEMGTAYGMELFFDAQARAPAAPHVRARHEHAPPRRPTKQR